MYLNLFTSANGHNYALTLDYFKLIILYYLNTTFLMVIYEHNVYFKLFFFTFGLQLSHYCFIILYHI